MMVTAMNPPAQVFIVALITIICLLLDYKFILLTGHEGPEGEQMYSYTLSLTLALDAGR